MTKCFAFSFPSVHLMCCVFFSRRGNTVVKCQQVGCVQGGNMSRWMLNVGQALQGEPGRCEVLETRQQHHFGTEAAVRLRLN